MKMNNSVDEADESDNDIQISGLFLSKSPLKDIFSLISAKWNNQLSLSNQAKIISSTFKHPTCLKYPPSSCYRRRFIRQLIETLEKANQEVNEVIYNEYIRLLNEDQDLQETDYCSFLVYSCYITIKQTNRLVKVGTTGHFCWEAGKRLATFALNNPIYFTNKRIVELGAGLGLTGIFINKLLKPQEYIFTDHHPSIMELLTLNTSINNCRNFSIFDLDWFSQESIITSFLIKHSPHLIIAADIIYNPLFHSSICKIIKIAIHLNISVLISCALRNESTQINFEQLLDQNKFTFDKYLITSSKDSIFCQPYLYPFIIYFINLKVNSLSLKVDNNDDNDLSFYGNSLY